jgi:NADPH-dependent curcumin reductase CurA
MPDPLHALINKVRSQRSSRLNNPTSAQSTNRQVALSVEELAIQIALEHLRQARYSFNLSLSIVAVGAVVSFAGAGLLLSGKTTEGAVAAAGSIASSICQLAKEANDRLMKSASALKDEE